LVVFKSFASVLPVHIRSAVMAKVIILKNFICLGSEIKNHLGINV